MCTVTYLPGKDGFILTSNRDEKKGRPPALLPEIKELNGIKLIYPTDDLHHGTWIAGTESGRVLCLLNGGFQKHIPEKHYKKSRGLVLLNALEYDNVQDFMFRYNLTGIEPFTLIFKDPDKLSELRWNGTRQFIRHLDLDKPWIWSSVTLYSEEIISERNRWFQHWLEHNPEFRINDILDFHLFGGVGNKEIDLRMSRNSLYLTVSITSIQVRSNSLEMWYKDLVHENETRLDFKLKPNHTRKIFV